MTEPHIIRTHPPVTEMRRPGKKGWLSKEFILSAVAGAGVALAFKTCALSLLCTAGAPAAVSTIIACAGAGLLVGTLKAGWNYRKTKKDNPETVFWTKQNVRSIAINTAISTVAGSLMFAFGDVIADKVAGLFGNNDALADLPGNLQPVGNEQNIVTDYEELQYEVISEPEPAEQPEAEKAPEPEPQPEPEPEAPAIGDQAEEQLPEEPQPSATEQFLLSMTEQSADLTVLYANIDTFVSENNITDQKLIELVESAKSGSAQAIKDLAAVINTEGKILCIDIPKDSGLVVQLYEAAVGQGNKQAMIDYAFMQNFGHNGIESNKEAAVALLQHVMDNTNETGRLHEIAACFYEQWTEGFNGKDCVGQTVCETQTAELQTPPIEPAPEPEPKPVETPVEDSGPREGQQRCRAIINADEVRFLCENERAVFDIGDTVRFYPKAFLPN